MKDKNIRNFCIIAHIDHGKSTLADRLLEVTKTVEARVMRSQHLDTLDLERERGITIKLQPVCMEYEGVILNLIDTPGHVDFTYEVSRSLAAVEGAILLVDATQGVQAQTLANLYLAMDQNVEIIPVVNKVDLANADIERTLGEIEKLLGCRQEDIIRASGKTGIGVAEILEAVTKRISSPRGQLEAPLRALIFDSVYDEYRGVVVFVRVVDGVIKTGSQIHFAATGATAHVEEVGILRPDFHPRETLQAGEIGYIVTGLKDVKLSRVGDTVLASGEAATTVLPGYREVKPVVYVGIFPKEGDAHRLLRDALDKLSLNDAALQFEPEYSSALGYGFRAGFLGLLHLEITQERLRREYGLDLVVTVPSVAYKACLRDGSMVDVRNPWDLPSPETLDRVDEPWVTLDIVTPSENIGGVMPLVASKRGIYKTTEYLGDRAILKYQIPLQSILVDFYDKLKGVSAGYASMNYDITHYAAADVVRLDILVAEEAVEAFSVIVYRDEAYHRGKRMIERLKDTLPRQQFVVKLQAAVGGKILAAERLSAMRKDVTAGLYGGDVTRKRKVLEKQKRGKKRMAEHGKGKVDIPSETYISLLRQ
ncbi:MAG: translation elongation factor 4 [Patescibacteria group bacterium]